MRVLVVEDEPRIASFVKQALTEQGFDVLVAATGDEGYDLAQHESFDLLVLDIMLPGRDGLSILRNLRAQRNRVPVILLTARGELHERLEGLDLGADDYLCKPFFVEELIARIHAVFRRAAGDGLSLRQAGALTVNLSTREVRREGRAVDLTAREFGLLEYLLRSPGRVLPRTQILEHVWGYDFDPQSNLVDVTIRRLRKKIESEGEEPLIETIRGVGYRFRETAGSRR
ncbi:MAG: response regulator transcription factor [Fimbriimonadaceae bacterium]|nr:response regulator transcription factor [Fimbriimonadaceae bacterium]